MFLDICYCLGHHQTLTASFQQPYYSLFFLDWLIFAHHTHTFRESSIHVISFCNLSRRKSTVRTPQCYLTLSSHVQKKGNEPGDEANMTLASMQGQNDFATAIKNQKKSMAMHWKLRTVSTVFTEAEGQQASLVVTGDNLHSSYCKQQ